MIVKKIKGQINKFQSSDAVVMPSSPVLSGTYGPHLSRSSVIYYFDSSTLGTAHLTLEGGGVVGDFEKKIPASACRKKKIACSTNVIESLWEKRGKTHQIARKKFLMTRNHPSPPLKS